MIVYGIKTCGTVQKALAALTEAGKAPVLRDVRAEPLSPDEIAEFEAAFGEKLVNRASMTWRKLSDDERAQPVAALIAAHPTLMKRPVIRGNGLTLGWTKDSQAAQLGG
ncbi:arsenate reductase-like glutaredoxin family protein [Rhodobacter aestuarii]|uniref:Arsenate reductase, glutaredoxin family n=1 Tax=Rhodobacter aestuarii TaxID=453582 RepID=A0A1N7J565_9RHOB|nr:ArsC/Spx/MgsR family protein [Rhodobacter aestuarii]PTV97172.1 arsenate reductase-like glutaredoxin family protein [Rhodobacter aestuarii]SIS44454.1 Arsenate reductase, glutaredoxin family [Rhodobacter aestuarii]